MVGNFRTAHASLVQAYERPLATIFNNFEGAWSELTLETENLLKF